MQRCNCTVRLSGDVGNTVEKSNVSPAEIAILTEIHGEGSVINIQPTHMDKIPHQDERSRLSTIYGEHVVDRLFPGQFTKLPVSLKDIARGDGGEEEAEGSDGETGGEGNSGDVAVVEPEDPPVPVEDEDDRLLREQISNATVKADLYQIAKDNEVDLSSVPDKLADLKAAILKGVFGGE